MIIAQAHRASRDVLPRPVEDVARVVVERQSVGPTPRQ